MTISELETLCKHAASKLFDEIDIVSEKMPCFDNIFLQNKGGNVRMSTKSDKCSREDRRLFLNCFGYICIQNYIITYLSIYDVIIGGLFLGILYSV